MVKILTVDDSSFIRTMIKKRLGKEGYKEVIEASTGKQAVELYKKEKPDLVLLDIIMGEELSGIETLKAIKELDSDAKVLMVTVIEQKEIAKQAEKLGAIGYIKKPFDEKDLVEKVKKVLVEWSNWSQKN